MILKNTGKRPFSDPGKRRALEENENFIADLIGLDVVTDEGVHLEL